MYDNVNEMLGRCHAERMARLQTTQRTMEVHGHGVVICERVGESIGATMWPEGALPMMEAMWTWERWAPDIGLPMALDVDPPSKRATQMSYLRRFARLVR
eukprot:GEMP01075808.1.p3 GENE.GEMP01075808.1~~GEMP01075808.1.p3  ORF type:complete len:100 (+),score=23.11 GEMP01075808.1:149-448(+)